MHERLRALRLSLLFALAVFLVIFTTLLIVIGGLLLLVHFGLAPENPDARVPLFQLAVACLIIGTILAFAFSGRPLKPLRQIMDATDRIAAGDYSVRLDLKGPDEFRQLSGKFNHMAEELGGVEMLRRDFIGDFSHEFKTPIVSIRGFARALKWDDLSPEERDEYLDIIIDESQRLSDLSSNVLALSKVENQAILADRSRFNLTEQVRLAMVLLDEKASRKGIRLSLSGDECDVGGDREMLKQVWVNLLDNAVKFCPEQGRVEVRVERRAQAVSVEVFNEGEPIAPEAFPRIFEKFYQGDSSRGTAGNGLGLAIARKVVELHGGSISVRPVEGGNVFAVELPA